ncbi:MAG: hypothetical protein ACI4VK_01605 [Candidatus Coproplasma sp.]
MVLKKINAVSALAAMLVAICHIGIMSYSLWTGWYNYNICKGFAWATASLFSLHVLLSLIIFFFIHDPSKVRYKKHNVGVIIQRVSAILMLLLIHLHTSAYAHVATGEVLSTGVVVLRIITEILFFGSVLVHMGDSCPKALITLGVLPSERAFRVVAYISCIFCGLLFIVTAGGVINFYVSGIA